MSRAGSRRIAIALLAAAVASVSVLGLGRDRARQIVRSFRTSSSPGASAYDVASGLLLGGLYDEIARDSAAAVAGIAEPSVLEVGPGPGHVAERLLRRAPTARWTGLDIDPAMLRAARRRLQRRGLAGRATLVEGDVAALPFADASFDLVVSSFSAHHWPDPASGFREIRRVLRPGAPALVYDLPEAWGHVETGSRGIGASEGVFGERTVRRVRGLGPLVIVRRVDLRDRGPRPPG